MRVIEFVGFAVAIDGHVHDIDLLGGEVLQDGVGNFQGFKRRQLGHFKITVGRLTVFFKAYVGQL